MTDNASAQNRVLLRFDFGPRQLNTLTEMFYLFSEMTLGSLINSRPTAGQRFDCADRPMNAKSTCYSLYIDRNFASCPRSCDVRPIITVCNLTCIVL